MLLTAEKELSFIIIKFVALVFADCIVSSKLALYFSALRKVVL